MQQHGTAHWQVLICSNANELNMITEKQLLRAKRRGVTTTIDVARAISVDRNSTRPAGYNNGQQQQHDILFTSSRSYELALTPVRV